MKNRSVAVAVCAALVALAGCASQDSSEATPSSDSSAHTPAVSPEEQMVAYVQDHPTDFPYFSTVEDSGIITLGHDVCSSWEDAPEGGLDARAGEIYLGFQVGGSAITMAEAENLVEASTTNFCPEYESRMAN